MTTESQAAKLRALNEASLAGIHGRAYREHMRLFDWFDANVDAIADLIEAVERHSAGAPTGCDCRCCQLVRLLAALTPVPEAS